MCCRDRAHCTNNPSDFGCAEVLQYTPKYTASEAAGTPLPIKVKTLGKLSYKMHVQPVLGAKSLDVIFVQVWCSKLCLGMGYGVLTWRCDACT